MGINVSCAELRITASKNGVEERVIIRVRAWCQEISFENMDGYSLGATNGNLNKLYEILSQFCDAEDYLTITNMLIHVADDEMSKRLMGQI